MKAFILSAGLGTRLKPLTDKLPKPLIPVQGRPLIAHIISQLKNSKQLNLEHIAINTHHLAHIWSDYQQQLSEQGIPISYHHEPELLDSGGGIANLAQQLQQTGQLDETQDEDILIYNGDIWTNLDLDQLIQAHKQSNNSVTLALQNQGQSLRIYSPNTDKQASQPILDIADPPAHANLNDWHQFTGIYLAKTSWILSLPQGKHPIIPHWKKLIQQQKLGATVLSQKYYWSDLGTPSSYNAVK